MKYLEQNWHHALPALFVFSLIYTVVFILDQGFALFLLWLHLPVYFAHEFEEYIFPSGWMGIMKRNAFGDDGVDSPYLVRSCFWINVGTVWCGFTISLLLATYVHLAFGLFAVFFSLFAVLPHFGLFAKQRYNPGFVASLVLNLPVAVATLYVLATSGSVEPWMFVVGAVAALVGYIPMLVVNKRAKELGPGA